jgi:hypothetical protein
MRKLALAFLFLLGCSSPTPASNEEWAARCTRIMEDEQPNKHERFEACVQDWESWLKANR